MGANTIGLARLCEQIENLKFHLLVGLAKEDDVAVFAANLRNLGMSGDADYIERVFREILETQEPTPDTAKLRTFLEGVRQTIERNTPPKVSAPEPELPDACWKILESLESAFGYSQEWLGWSDLDTSWDAVLLCLDHKLVEIDDERFEKPIVRFTHDGILALARHRLATNSEITASVPPQQLSGDLQPGTVAKVSGSASSKTIKPKEDTQTRGAQIKLISALTLHHEYADGGCRDFKAIRSNELARLAQVSQSTANLFFNKWFGSAKKAKDGYSNYKVVCNDKGKLIAFLKAMNNELPRPGEVLFGRKVPDAAENSDHHGDRRRKQKASELRHGGED